MLHVNIRYYRCLRATPSRAKGQNKPVCVMPHIPAAKLEAHVWDLITTTLLSEEYLERQLALAHAEHAEVNERRISRIAILDREVERHRRRLANTLDELADAERGSESATLLRTQAATIEATVKRLTGERADLMTTPAVGLSPEQGQALRDFAAEARAIVKDTPGGWSAAEQRHIYDLLRLAGRIRVAESGDAQSAVIIGQRAYYLDWQAAIRLVHNVTTPTRLVMPLARKPDTTVMATITQP
jgi:hypothetical protein